MGVTTIDTGFPQPTAVYVVDNGCGDGGVTLVGAGPPKGLPKILQNLESEGIATTAVTSLVLLDLSLPHATGAANVLDACPNATLLVHPHMVEALTTSGAMRQAGKTLYGETFEPVFGKVSHVNPARVKTVQAGEGLPGSEGCHYEFMHLPESMALLANATHSAFVGNVLGAVYPSLTGRTGARLGIPVPSGDRLHPDLSVAAVDMIARQAGIQRAFTTHYGLVTDLHATGEAMRRAVRVFESIAVQALRMHMRGDMLRQFCQERISQHIESEAEKAHTEWSEEAQALLAIEIGLNTQATTRLVEWAHDEGLSHLDNDAAFHSEYEGGRLRVKGEKLSVQHIEMLVRSWNHTEHMSWTTGAEADGTGQGGGAAAMT